MNTQSSKHTAFGNQAITTLVPTFHIGRVQAAKHRKSITQKIAELYVDESIVREVEEEDNPIVDSDMITIYL
jgi:hypothetical protein